MLQQITYSDCDRDVKMTKLMNVLVLESWHKYSPSGFCFLHL